MAIEGRSWAASQIPLIRLGYVFQLGEGIPLDFHEILKPMLDVKNKQALRCISQFALGQVKFPLGSFD